MHHVSHSSASPPAPPKLEIVRRPAAVAVREACDGGKQLRRFPKMRTFQKMRIFPVGGFNKEHFIKGTPVHLARCPRRGGNYWVHRALCCFTRLALALGSTQISLLSFMLFCPGLPSSLCRPSSSSLCHFLLPTTYINSHPTTSNNAHADISNIATWTRPIFAFLASQTWIMGSSPSTVPTMCSSPLRWRH